MTFLCNAIADWQVLFNEVDLMDYRASQQQASLNDLATPMSAGVSGFSTPVLGGKGRVCRRGMSLSGLR